MTASERHSADGRVVVRGCKGACFAAVWSGRVWARREWLESLSFERSLGLMASNGVRSARDLAILLRVLKVGQLT